MDLVIAYKVQLEHCTYSAEKLLYTTLDTYMVLFRLQRPYK